MYTTIRRYTIEREKMSQLMRDIRQNFLPLISQVPGFLAYDAVDAGDRLVTVSMFETKEGATESTRRTAQYVKGQKAFQLADVEITEGEVTVHKAAERGIGASHTSYTR
jgi:hypothetical protein